MTPDAIAICVAGMLHIQVPSTPPPPIISVPVEAFQRNLEKERLSPLTKAFFIAGVVFKREDVDNEGLLVHELTHWIRWARGENWHNEGEAYWVQRHFGGWCR